MGINEALSIQHDLNPSIWYLRSWHQNLACLLLICGDSVCLSVRICTMFDSLFFSFRDIGVSLRMFLKKSTSVIYVYFKFHISYLWALMRPYQFNMIWIQAFDVWGVDIEKLTCLLLICGDSVCLSVRICTMFDSLFFLLEI